MVPYGIPFAKWFLLYNAALFSNCRLRRWTLFIGGNHHINKIGEFFQFFFPNAKELGHEISEWWSENMTILMVPKSQWLWKKWNKIRPGSFKAASISDNYFVTNKGATIFFGIGGS